MSKGGAALSSIRIGHAPRVDRSAKIVETRPNISWRPTIVWPIGTLSSDAPFASSSEKVQPCGISAPQLPASPTTVTNNGSPSRPSLMRDASYRIVGCAIAWLPQTVRTSRSAASAARWRVSSKSCPSGHSQKTCLPAAKAFSTKGPWRSARTLTTTTSMSGLVHKASALSNAWSMPH